MPRSEELGVYEQLIHELASREHRGVVVTSATADRARFALPDGSTAVVIRFERGCEAELVGMLDPILTGHRSGRLQLIVAGGDHAPRALLARRIPKLALLRRVGMFAVDQAGDVWSAPKSEASRELAAALADVQRRPGVVRLDRDGFDRWLSERAGAAEEVRHEVAAHHQETRRRRTPVVWALAATAVAVFGLELAWGGADSITTLVSMGALVDGGSHATEPWRPLAMSFLHTGWGHLAGSLLILVLLGGFWEKLVGPSRLLVLWVASIAGGSLSALLFSDASVVVGASGGAWGLMCAAGVLSVRPGGLIPDQLAGPMRKRVAGVLGVNLGISFLPGVSLSAHLGGGLTGALVAATGLATLGMRRAEHSATRAGRPPAEGAVRGLGIFAAVALLGSLAAALAMGQPWESPSEGPWSTHDLGVPGLQIEVPQALGDPDTRTQPPVAFEYEFGDALGSPWTVSIRVTRVQPKALTSLRLFREFRLLKRGILDEPLPEGASRPSEPVEGEVGMVFTLDEVIDLADGARLIRHTRLVPVAAVQVTVTHSAQAVEAGDGIAERVIASLVTGYEEPASPSESSTPAASPD